MNNYEENMNSAKYNIAIQIDRAYHQGYADAKSEKGQNVIDLAHKEIDRAYQRGLNEAWEAAKKIHDGQIPYEVFGLDKTGNGITYASPLNWGEVITAQKVIAKIKEYEQQKQDPEIKVGDEVYSEMNDLRFIVTRIITSKHMDITVKRYEGICTDGACYDNLPEDIVKTGRTFPQISEVLEKMRGDKE